MRPLTERQAAILAFLQDQIGFEGMPPTRAEIGKRFGFQSRASAEEQLRVLERKGYVELLADSPRGIKLTALGQAPRPVQHELPLIGSIAAGTPILAEVNVETRIALNRDLFRPAADFLHRVSGHSMTEAGILDGDLVGIHAQSEADNNQIVAAVVADARTGEEFITLKRYIRRGPLVILKPENNDPRYQPIEIDLSNSAADSQEPTRFRIAGIFAGLIRVPQ